MTIYDDLKYFIQDGMYTIVQCQEMLNNYYKHMQITNEQYDELMEMAKELEANDDEDIDEIKYIQLSKRIEVLENDVTLIKSLLEQGGSEIPPVEEPDGSLTKPITAYAGMTYYKDKYYKDPTNDKIYICTRDSDIKPGSGITLNYLPNQLVGIYFSLYEAQKDLIKVL